MSLRHEDAPKQTAPAHAASQPVEIEWKLSQNPIKSKVLVLLFMRPMG